MFDKKNLKDFFTLNLLLLILYGIVVFYTSSFFISDKLKGDPNYFFYKRVILLFWGIIIFFIFSNISLEFLNKIVPLLLLLSFGLLILSFFSTSISGAKRWIIFYGISIQPSEFIKFSFIIYLARFLSKYDIKKHNNFSFWSRPLIIFLIFWILIIIQNDYSTAMYFALLFFAIIFVAEIPMRYIFYMTSFLAPISVFFVLTKSYRISRFLIFLNPYSDPSGKGYQIISSINALKSGSVFGKGIGMGEIKLGRLPEAHSDFIFAVLAEELGLVGVFFVIFLFLTFLYLGVKIALEAKNKYEFLIALSATLSIFMQALMNIAIVIGLLPPTGINLPFFSSGGSSILITMILSGLIGNVAKNL